MGTAGSTTLKTKVKAARPRRYRVLMHNDNFTTMDFVILMLTSYFDKEKFEAEKIMWQIHTQGIGLCGIYSREIAETRINLVHSDAQRAEFPLRCTMEPIDESEND